MLTEALRTGESEFEDFYVGFGVKPTSLVFIGLTHMQQMRISINNPSGVARLNEQYSEYNAIGRFSPVIRLPQKG